MSARGVVLAGLALAFAARADGAPAEPPAPPFYADRTNLLQVVDATGALRPIKDAADLALRRRHTLEHMTLVMGRVPEEFRATALAPRVIEEAAEPKFTRKKIALRVEPADTMTAYLLLPRGLTGKAPAVLCLHQTTAMGKAEPAGLGGDADLAYARELAERGYVTLAPDCWDFGDYRRSPYDPYAQGYASGTMKSLWNHMRALDYLASLPEVDAERIGCIGHSLGGHNTLWLAAFDPRVKAAVSSCGFCSMASYAASPYGGGTLKGWAQRRYMPRVETVYGNDPRRLPFDWHEVLAAIAPRPVFISAPLRDENFSAPGVKECVEAARAVYAFLGAEKNLAAEYPDAAHSFPPEARAAAYARLDAALR
ncbi:MAG TPA: dienelactone hydrolase family protein [Planctomycetota bacterium]|jgi:dienelactone hydrolase|nr:dienelactone hydrolase family protein [Planctomycetota bacterium]OQC19225.1 MAG: Dienelactone hydrolase family protein [Planctomycetes bacterium ADurb.Bin069]HNS00320.1 dienelactone hydrolase family protein [Planctomycetota bacterium]HNU27326.1 dienelactone hydrolase family protein [Planctomycetota bacterium]HOE31117.1 dienelactone hydrolase family protein [Planctomycetota bacterium]